MGTAFGFGPSLEGPIGESCVIVLPSGVVWLTGLVQVVSKPAGTVAAAAGAATAAAGLAAAEGRRASPSCSAASAAAAALAHSAARALASPPAAKAASAAFSREESVVESRSAAEGCLLLPLF